MKQFEVGKTYGTYNSFRPARLKVLARTDKTITAYVDVFLDIGWFGEKKRIRAADVELSTSDEEVISVKLFNKKKSTPWRHFFAGEEGKTDLSQWSGYYSD